MEAWGEHKCEECQSKDHCSLEPIARYFGNRPDEEDEVTRKVDALLFGDWSATVGQDILSHGGSGNYPLDIAITMLTGYLLGKGIDIPQITPDMGSRSLRALAKILERTKKGGNYGNTN